MTSSWVAPGDREHGRGEWVHDKSKDAVKIEAIFTSLALQSMASGVLLDGVTALGHVEPWINSWPGAPSRRLLSPCFPQALSRPRSKPMPHCL